MNVAADGMRFLYWLNFGVFLWMVMALVLFLSPIPSMYIGWFGLAGIIACITVAIAGAGFILSKAKETILNGWVKVSICMLAVVLTDGWVLMARNFTTIWGIAIIGLPYGLLLGVLLYGTFK